MILSILIRLVSISVLLFIRMSNSEDYASSEYYEDILRISQNDDTTNPATNNQDIISSNNMSETLAKVNGEK